MFLSNLDADLKGVGWFFEKCSDGPKRRIARGVDLKNVDFSCFWHNLDADLRI